MMQVTRRGFTALTAGLVLLGTVAMAGASLSGTPGGSMNMMGPVGAPRVARGPVTEAPVVVHANGIVEGRSVMNDVSAPLRDMKGTPLVPAAVEREFDLPAEKASAPVKDAVLQDSFGASMFAMPAPALNVPGLTNRNGVYPPDTSGEVGPNHYMQWVNLSLQIFNKSGVSVYGPVNGNTLWNGFGGACSTQNAGDPVVLYDQFAGRWVVSQFTSSSPYGECVAVSTTNDPTGTWYRYFFQHSTSIFYDYPHMGVWSDGYYTTFNKFKMPAGIYQGATVVVYDRAKMLNGQPAGFQEKPVSSSYGTLQPADIDGSTLPPAGSAHISVARSGTSGVNFWKFAVNWANPASSTFTGPTTVGVAAYTALCGSTRSCVAQPGTSVGLDGLGSRFMFRLTYRNFGTYQALVGNHSVNAVTSGTRAGVRWYEFRNVHSTPTLYQQSTYSPDATNRWMGSAAQDKQGNMALGYSVSSSSVYPGIRYTGRLVTDALGTLPQGEVTLVNGSGVQTGTGYRWGDYSQMTVDPVDDCTFWYTTEYVATTGTAPWITRIGSFKFSGCQ